jgi:phage terminase large subunit GpA-like protein
MDALSPSHPVEFVSVMKGSQLGFTECGNNWIGYVIDYAPGTMLIVNPGLNEVKRNTATRRGRDLSSGGHGLCLPALRGGAWGGRQDGLV